LLQTEGLQTEGFGVYVDTEGGKVAPLGDAGAVRFYTGSLFLYIDNPNSSMWSI